MLRPPRRSSLFPYTTLFRSEGQRVREVAVFAATESVPGHDDAAAKQLVSRIQRGQGAALVRSEEHTSELQSRRDLVCRLLLEKKKQSRYLPSCLPSRFHALP